MESALTKTTFSVSSLILGGVIGALINNLSDTGFTPVPFLLLILAVVAFAVISLFASSLKEQKNHQKSVLSTVASLEKRLGLKVSYQELKNIGGKTIEEDILAKLMREAEIEILEVSRSEVHEPKVNVDLGPPELRREYYDSIIKQVENQNMKGVDFNYKRIIQFPLINGNLTSLGDDVYIDHCKKMILLNQSKGIGTYIKRTLLTSPTSFLIIDRKYLIITLDRINYNNSKMEQHQKAEIIIFDPQQELINVFLKEWDTIENSPYTQTIRLDDFNDK